MVYIYLSNQIKFENLKSSLPLKRFIAHLSTTLNLKELKNQIKAYLSYLANSYFYKYKPSPHILHQHHIFQTFRKNKDIITTKPVKGNRVAILDQKLYNNTIQEIISDTSKFKKLNEDPNLKHEASLQRF